jgi:hypothetical protein
MTRYQLAAKPQEPAGGSPLSIRKSDLQLVLAQGDPWLTSTYASLLVAAARGRHGPFTAAQIREEIPSVQTGAGPSLGVVEAELAKLHALGLVTLHPLN